MESIKNMVGVYYLEDEDVLGDVPAQLAPHVNKGLPAIVMLQGNFCGYCTKAKPDYEKFVQEVKGRVEAVTSQSDGEPEGELYKQKGAYQRLAKTAGVRGVPSYALFDRQGNFIRAVSGVQTKEQLHQLVASL